MLQQVRNNVAVLGHALDGQTERRIRIWAPLKTVLFSDGGVSRVLTSACIRPYTPVFRARLPCPHQNAWFVEVP